MIIPRKYELFGILYKNDAKAKQVIDDAFSEIDPHKAESLIRYNHDRIIAWFDIGSGVSGEAYQKILKGFSALDITDPYDNGLTFRDVSKIGYESSRKGTAIQMRFYSCKADCPIRIIGVVAIKNDSGKLEIDKGWPITEPML